MFHPSAAENFDGRASLLLSAPKAVPRAPAAPASFESEFHPNFELREGDLVGEPQKASVDYRGRTIARSFYDDAREFEVGGNDYQLLSKLSEVIHRHGKVSDHLSIEYIENVLFDWIRTNYKLVSPATSFVGFLEAKSKIDVRKADVWTPIANFQIQSPLSLSKSTIRLLGKAEFERWRQLLSEKQVPPETIDAVLEDLRHKHQGRAAVCTPVEAEPIRAQEIALEEAELITSVLAILSPDIRMADVACTSRVSGCEHIRSTTRFIDIPGEDWIVSQSVLDPQFTRMWALSNADVATFGPAILDPIAAILKQPRTPFANVLLTSVLIYSKTAFTADPVEKIIYCLTALETILLKSESESIQQNLGERLAVFIAVGLAPRKAIVKCVRDVYTVRSRYLHHGKTLSELRLIEEFLGYVWRFWLQVAPNIPRFQTKEAFVSALDDHKLS